LLKTIGNQRSQLHFILQLGYFRAKQQFYTFNFEDVEADYRHIETIFFSDKAVSLTGAIAKSIILKQQHLILQRYHYKRWPSNLKAKTLEHLEYLIRLHPKGHDTFNEFVTAKLKCPL